MNRLPTVIGPRSQAGVWLGSLTTILSACGGGPPPTSPEGIANSTYLSQASPDGVVTLVGGSFEFPPGSPVDRIEVVASTTGDFDGNGQADAAVILVEISGDNRLLYLHALLGDGKHAEDVAARLLGDRVQVRGIRLEEGLASVDLTVRRPGENAQRPPSLPITNRFALTGRGFMPINPPQVREGASRTMASIPPTLTSHEWIVERIEMGEWAQSTDSLERRPTISFVRELGDEANETGTVSGYAGCNQLFGNYRRDADAGLGISGLAATRMMCSPNQMDLETRVLASFSAAQSFVIEDDELTVTFDGGSMRLRAGNELLSVRSPGTSSEQREDPASRQS